MSKTTTTTQWPKRPFDSKCKELVPPDEGCTVVVQKTFKDWDPTNPNWGVLFSELRDRGRTPDEIKAMGHDDIRDAFNTRLLRFSPTMTTTPDVIGTMAPNAEQAIGSRSGTVRVHVEPDDTIDVGEREILLALHKEIPMRLTIEDLEHKTSLSKQTVGTNLKRFIKCGWACRPGGDRGGAALTQKGIDLVATIRET